MPKSDTEGMFERYNEGARRVLFFARHELTALGGQTVEPAHLLLGLLRDKPTQRLLANWNVPIADVLRQIQAQVMGGTKIPSSVEVPFAPAVKRVLNFAAHEADRLLHMYVAPEHLVVALLRENDPVAAASLAAHGMTAETSRQYLASHPPRASRHPESETIQLVSPLVSLHIERIMNLARDLARTQSNSPEGHALVDQIDDELMMLMQQLE